MTRKTLGKEGTLNIYTLDELKTIKAEWLAVGASVFDDLIKIIETLGMEVNYHGWDPSLRVTVEEVQAECRTRVSQWLPKEGRFSCTIRLNIHYKGLHVCHMWRSDDPAFPATAEDQWFVPGPWLEMLLLLMPNANLLLANAQRDKDEAERKRLEDQLLIGRL